MAKGGFQRRRIQQKKQQERVARKRARRRRLIATWTSVVALAGLVALGVMVLSGGDGGKPLVQSSPTPSPTASPTGECTKKSQATAGKKKFDAPPCPFIDSGKTYTATFETSKGAIEVRLLATEAPQTVNNFVFLAQQGFYDGSPFHRVIPDFGKPGSNMVQGGDAVNRDGTGGPGYQFGDENMAPFGAPGLLAMANSGPGSNGSQFFFLSGPVDHLNRPGACPGQGCHSVFGTVTKGLDVISRIAAVPQGENNRPKQDVVLREVIIRVS